MGGYLPGNGDGYDQRRYEPKEQNAVHGRDLDFLTSKCGRPKPPPQATLRTAAVTPDPRQIPIPANIDEC
jgi:hypothetical protein